MVDHHAMLSEERVGSHKLARHLEPGERFRSRGGAWLTVDRALWRVTEREAVVRSVEGPVVTFGESDLIEVC